jgi:virginiamycin B lyase
MQSLYAVMIILALFSFLYILHQEQELDILPVYAVHQEQEQDQTDESKAEQADTFNTASSLFYPITGILLDTSPISNSSKNQGAINDNFSEVALHNGLTLKEFPVPLGSSPHDVAPSLSDNNVVWYTAQALGELGKINTSTGKTHHISLGQGSAPHGVIVGPDGAPWITDGGLNAIVRVDPITEDVKTFPLPDGNSPFANLNTATFDKNGTLWFTGQSGIYGRLYPSTGQMEIFEAPKGPGPYGISVTPNGTVYFASLAGSYIARIDPQTGGATVIEPPTPDQGARRVWSDSQGQIWVSEWNVGKLGMYSPKDDGWKEWRLPGDNPMPYAVYVDEKDMVWISDFGSNAFVRFDPINESFEIFNIPSQGSNVRQILGKPDVIWGAESGTDKLVSIHTKPIR